MPDAPERVWASAAKLLNVMGIELVDIEVLGGSRDRLVRVTIDQPRGVDHDLCAEASEVLDSLFEEIEPVSGGYTLEVSSPGLERKLRGSRQWKRCIGENVKVKLAGGAGVVRGALLEVDEQGIVVEAGDGGREEIPFDEVVSGQTVFNWDDEGG